MDYKITREEEAIPYEAAGHFNMRATRLHNPGDIDGGKLVIGLSHFLPGGGCE